MNNISFLLKKIGKSLFGTRASGLYILLFAASIGIATFIENDFGTSAAQKVVYKTAWFELLLVLFCISLIVNIVKFRMIPQKKWALLFFHVAMIIIIIGAAITRYYGYEGMMHIRENDQSNSILSRETYLNFEVIKDGQKYRFDEPVLFSSLGKNSFEESYLIGDDLIEVKLIDFIPNPIQVIEKDENGRPVLKIVLAGTSGREEYYISPGEVVEIGNTKFDFTGGFIPGAVNLDYKDNNLTIQADRILTQMTMASRQIDTLYPVPTPHLLRLNSLYTNGDIRFVFPDFHPSGVVRMVSENKKMKSESLGALLLQVIVNNEDQLSYVYGQQGVPGRPMIMETEDLALSISYGAKYIDLPFSIKLYDFIMERYPGTNSAASYASEVQLVDAQKNIKKDYRIFMNNILTHRGYRFFQSSYDTDEKGTYLSVNHDAWGTRITYLGYGLLTIGMILLFFSPNSRFYQVTKKLAQMRSAALILVFYLFCLGGATGQKSIDPSVDAISETHAALFSRIVVQDYRGRMKPMHTLTREVMRKMAKTESLMGLNADQIILSMYADKQRWVSIPMIKITEQEVIQNTLGVEGPLVAYKDFFNVDGSYKLREMVGEAYNLQPIDRGTKEKDLMKIDERVNIASMIYSGRILKIIPVEGDPNNTWVSTYVDHNLGLGDVPVASRFFENYKPELQKAIATDDYSLPDQLLTELIDYQLENGGEIIPSQIKVKAEILLNKLNVFSRLSLMYALLGLAFLALLFINVFKPDLSLKKVGKVLFGLLILGFALHTFGLGLRWYVSGRAPWSNGYESMIYIAWTTTLAGLIFTRKSYGGLAATMILAGTILLVAMLSYLDPEITPLVPVLRSYWLTIHVSLIAGSYGFLMLGAIIGIINLILMIFLTSENKKRIKAVINEMTLISEITLVGGLVMISIGTYLGGVWANESWGRYWGWDAKETWALVTILVYAFILHMRIIPKIYTLYSFNLATLFGFASVVMTYFGVNYYLSGLHSYAAGDPIPIPTWVYIAIASVALISITAWWRKRAVQF